MFNNILYLLNSFSKNEKYNFFLLILLSSIFELISIGAFFPIIISIVNPEIISSNYIYNYFFSNKIQSQKDLILLFIFILIFIFFIKSLLLSLIHKKLLKICANFDYVLASKIYEKYLSKNLLFFSKSNLSDLTRNSLMSTTIASSINNFYMIVSEFIILLIASIFLLYKFFFISITVLVLTTLIFLLYKTLFSKKLVQLGKNRIEADGNSFKNFNDTINSIILIKIFQLKNYFQKKYLESKKQAVNFEADRQFYNVLPSIWSQFIFLVYIFIYLYVELYKNVVASDLIINTSILGIVVLRLMPSLNRIASNYQTLKYTQSFFELFKHELSNNEYPENQKIDEKNIFLPITVKQIIIDKISFTYNLNKKFLIKKFSKQLNQGEIILIQGQSGSGKTTLAGLIMGLIKPDEGKIYFENETLFSTNFKWKDYFSYVPQNSIIMNDTIDNNIAIGEQSQNQDNKKIEYLKKIFNLKDLDNKLLGENGKQISGGQSQRIGICRALYKDSPIIVMDEPTSLLDKENENNIISIINNIKEKNNKIIIIISHKKLDNLNVDKIINFNDDYIRDEI